MDAPPPAARRSSRGRRGTRGRSGKRRGVPRTTAAAPAEPGAAVASPHSLGRQAHETPTHGDGSNSDDGEEELAAFIREAQQLRAAAALDSCLPKGVTAQLLREAVTELCEACGVDKADAEEALLATAEQLEGTLSFDKCGALRAFCPRPLSMHTQRAPCCCVARHGGMTAANAADLLTPQMLLTHPAHPALSSPHHPTKLHSTLLTVTAFLAHPHSQLDE